MRLYASVDERDFRERASGNNLRSCDRYKRNIFLFPGNISERVKILASFRTFTCNIPLRSRNT